MIIGSNRHRHFWNTHLETFCQCIVYLLFLFVYFKLSDPIFGRFDQKLLKT